MSSYDLHNFIEDYPCQNDPDIQWNIASRKEFNELISDKDKLEKVDRFFKHQQVFLRYLRQYDRILNIQATGTGKSGTVINAAEYFKKSNGNIKRVYVLEPGPATISDFKNQIKKLSDPEEYLNDKLKYSMSKISYNNNITRLLKEWYTVETYGSFAKKNYNDKTIEEEFSDCLFFFDEAHILRNKDDGEDNTFLEDDREKIYNFLWRVTHIAKRSKFIVGTATPMVKNVEDFVPLLNLLLPMNYQLPSSQRIRKDFYDTVTLNQLEPYLRGKVTFIKFSESNINIINKGQQILNYNHIIEVPVKKNSSVIIKPAIKKIEDGKIISVREPRQEYEETKKIKIASQIKLLNLPMKDIQLETYIKIIGEKNQSFYIKQLQTSVFVYPNGDFGVRGFEKYIEKDNLGEFQFRGFIKERNKVIKGLYPHYINEEDLETSLKNLKFMSSKFHFFIEKEYQASQNEKPGNSFCYIVWDKASGATLLGMILRIFGFSEYKSNFSPRDIRSNKLLIDKRKRFLLLTGDTKNVQESLNLFNSYENRHGEYIQILIASKKAQVGINVKNVKRGYIMTPGWHESGTYQALSRFIRADSHDMLFEEEGNKIDVEIFRLNATAKKESIDTFLYLKSELRDIKNKRIIRFMKQCAFDAFLNYDRNINLPQGTKDGSIAADYSDIKFKIFSAEGLPGNKKRRGIALNQGPNPGDYIYNTYNLLYSENLIKELKEKIKNIISKEKTITISKLKEDLKTKNTDYIFNSALEELIFNREIIGNKQNTIFYYLEYSSDLLYLQRESIFQNQKISTENNLYLDNSYPYIEKITELKGEIKIRALDNFYENFKELSEEELKNYYIQNQDYLLFRTLLEDSLIRLKNNDLMEINKIVLKLFSNYILVTTKPISYIEASREALKPDREAKQGRKRTSDSLVGLEKLKLDKVKDKRTKEKIYCHFYKDTGQDAFAINTILESKKRTVRILDEAENNFRDTGNAENYVYNYLFDLKYDKLLERFRKARYYATIIYRAPGNISIVEKEKLFFRIIDNTNKNNRGKICGNYGGDTLIKILKYLDDKGKYKKLMEKKIKKPVLCPLLQRLFEEKGLIFYSF